MLAKDAAAARVGHREHATSVQPGQAADAEEGFFGDAVAGVAVQQRRVAAIEQHAGLVDDAHRHHRAVVALYQHLGGQHIARRVVGPVRLQPGVDDAAIGAHLVDLARTRPAVQVQQHTRQVGARAVTAQVEGSQHGQRHFFSHRIVAVGAAQQLLHVAVARGHVECVAGHRQARQHAAALGHHRRCRGHASAIQAPAHDLEARSALVCERIKEVALQRQRRHLVFIAGQLFPFGLAGQNRRRRAVPHRQFIGIAVLDQQQRAPVGLHLHQRRLGSADAQVLARAHHRAHARLGGTGLHEHDHAALVLLDLRQALAQRLQAVKEEAAAVGQPAHATKMDALHLGPDLAPRARVEHAQCRFLRATGRHPQRHQAAVGRGGGVVDGVTDSVTDSVTGGGTGGLSWLARLLLQQRGVEDHRFLALQTLAHDELELVVIGTAPLVDGQLAGQPRQLDHPRRGGSVEPTQFFAQRRTAADAAQHRLRVLAVRLHPGGHGWLPDVFEVAVEVVDLRREEGFGHVAHRGRR